MSNHEIARLLRNIAAAYRIKNEKKYLFQILAYQKAADSIEHQSEELKDLYENGELEKVPGIGASIKSHIEELFKKGKVKHFETVTKGVPDSVFPLLDIPGFGPKKAFKIVEAFKLNNAKTVMDDIENLAASGKIAEIPTFGDKSQSDIARAVKEFRLGKSKSKKLALSEAYTLAQKIVDYLKKLPEVKDAKPLGSLRRMKSTVGDIDIAIAGDNEAKILDHFVEFPGKIRLIEKGERTASILLTNEIQVDVMVQKPESFGSLLQHFTGSKEHNVALREYAIKKQMSLSEYGIKILKNGGPTLRKFKTEEEFYKFLGLEWIPPEIRENMGEIELAEKKQLPNLVEFYEIKGDLHIHSNINIESSHDLGIDPMDKILEKAKKLKYEYIGFSEHNPSVSKHTLEQVYSLLSGRKSFIEQLNRSNKDVRAINLLEVDINPDGDVSVDDKSLELVDAIIVSIHSSFSMQKDQMTKRILKALDHSKVKILGHPTGRIINQRSELNVDWNLIFEKAVQRNIALEINAWPTRLDLPDELVYVARKKGVKFIINTDSHALDQMDHMLYGISVARRGWCTKENILNTLPYHKFFDWIKS